MIRNGRSRVKPAPPPGRARGAGRTGVVSRVLCPDPGWGRAGSFIWDPDRSEPRAAHPGLGRGRRPLVLYSALLRVGFAMRPPLPAARCALTAPFHPCLCPGGPSAVCSLRHFPSPRGARALPGTLPCGARTFLRPASPGDSRRRSLGPSSRPMDDRFGQAPPPSPPRRACGRPDPGPAPSRKGSSPHPGGAGAETEPEAAGSRNARGPGRAMRGTCVFGSAQPIAPPWKQTS